MISTVAVRFPLALILFSLLAGPIAIRNAPAQEIQMRGSDLWITATAPTNWTGGGWGGYQPIPLTVVNRGAARNLEFRFTPYETDHNTTTVVRRLQIDSQATAELTLLIPLVSHQASGLLSVLVDGQAHLDFQEDISLAERSFQRRKPPGMSLLFISPTAFDSRSYHLGARVVGIHPSDTGPAGPPQGFSLSYPGLQNYVGPPKAETIPPGTFPSTWLGYSAVDLVAIDLATLTEARPAERGALFDWVATGGRLIIHKAGGFDDQASEFHKLLEQWHWNDSLAEWTPPGPRKRHVRTGREFYDSYVPPNEADPFSGPLRETRRESQFHREKFGRGRSGWRERILEPSWRAEPRPFAIARHAFGRVVVVSGDLTVANQSDWEWLLADLGGPAIPWAVRHGMKSGAGDIEFIELPIPGVRGVPTIAFLVLISLFAILIGPVNYVLLWRKGQLSRLVFTVPALAVITSLMLFAYGTLSHGFSTTGRIRSVTWIDAATNSATTVSRMSLFAGWAPSSGLRFSNDTAVYPLLPLGEEFQGGTVDWSERQSLTDGWFNTRTRTQFVTVNSRDERGRLRVAQTNGGLTVVNGFTMTLEHVIVNDSRGRAYYGRNLAPGEEQRLTPLTDEQRAAMRELAIDRIPEPPDGVEPRELMASLDRAIRSDYRHIWHPEMRLGLIERHLDLVSGSFGSELGGSDGEIPESTNRMLAAVREDTIDPLAAPRGFVAVTTENPAIDVGGLDVEERGSLHLLMGIW